MGMEYKLTFVVPDAAALLQSLGRLPGARPTAELGGVEFVGDGRMPDASFTPTSYGGDFCDNGGAGREILGRIVAALLRHAPSVQVEEL